ncbi:hypothetical protein RhiirB3_428931 [Rhizophagus irregularis]|nr:hypothetical protein RhiirB3_428931 [Rhizophagus irregularis]
MPPKKQGRKKSPIWLHFIERPLLNSSHHEAKCKYCFGKMVFDPKYIYTGDISQKDIRQYNAIHEFANPPDELLREWGIYCRLGNNEVLGEIELNQYWLNKPKLL